MTLSNPIFMRISLLICSAFVSALVLDAHAILKESIPAQGAVLQGPEITVKLKFNSRIDAVHSRMYLDNGAGPRAIDIVKQESPDTLVGQAKQVMPGDYRVEWQVLAIDGHITRGELPFKVR